MLNEIEKERFNNKVCARKFASVQIFLFHLL
jgi:hypothetical protein